MQQIIDEINQQIATNQIDLVIKKLMNIFSLAKSPLESDATGLSAQFTRYKKEKRLRILSAESDSLQYNQIVYGLTSLLDEIRQQPDQFSTYQKLDKEIDRNEQEKLHRILPAASKEALYSRLTFVGSKDLDIKGLWIDDHPEFQEFEKKILHRTGLQFDEATSSATARKLLSMNQYELIISDISRNQDPTAGLDFQQEITRKYPELPFLFYIADWDPALGVPPFVFGMTNRMAELFHLVLDILERKY